MTHSVSTHPAAWMPLFGSLTTDEAREMSRGPRTVILLPIGSIEPHGPHLPLSTDTTISEIACLRAARHLADLSIDVAVAPSVPYGVTDYAVGFSGAIGVPPDVLTGFLRSLVERFLADGWTHVCIINNHLEPAQDAAVRAAVANIEKGRASVACPLTRRWARLLSDEFKRGDCHGGRYETSLALAAGSRVSDDHVLLPPVPISLADGIKEGKKTFLEMGIVRSYTGAPADATREEGEELFEILTKMIVTEVSEGIDLVAPIAAEDA